MKTKKTLFALLAIFGLTACGGGGVNTGEPFVKDGVKYQAGMIDNIPESTKNELLNSVKGVVVDQYIEMDASIRYDGQTESSSGSAKQKYVIDFENRTVELRGSSYSVKFQLNEYTVSIISKSGDTEDIIYQYGNYLTLSNIFNAYKTEVFSWINTPSGDEIKEMGDMLTDLLKQSGSSASISDTETAVTKLMDAFVVSPDYETGNFEFGLGNKLDVSFGVEISGDKSTFHLLFTNFRARFADYLLQEEVCGANGNITFHIQKKVLTIQMSTITYLSFSYIY